MLKNRRSSAEEKARADASARSINLTIAALRAHDETGCWPMAHGLRAALYRELAAAFRKAREGARP